MKIIQLVGKSSDNVIGSGRIELEEDEKSQRTVIDIDKLEKVIKIAKDLKWRQIVLRVQNNYPLFISNMNDEKQEVIGIVVCPLE